MSQTFQLTEHGDGVQIHWTMLRGAKQVLCATISRPTNYSKKGNLWQKARLNTKRQPKS